MRRGSIGVQLRVESFIGRQHAKHEQQTSQQARERRPATTGAWFFLLWHWSRLEQAKRRLTRFLVAQPSLRNSGQPDPPI